jgi:hypothetical protein
MKHEHESYDDCIVCNTQVALCKCGRDIRMSGGTKSPNKQAVCNFCLGICH